MPWEVAVIRGILASACGVGRLLRMLGVRQGVECLEIEYRPGELDVDWVVCVCDCVCLGSQKSA